MTNEEIEKALDYAEATSKIEDIDFTKEELLLIENAIKAGKANESFLFSLVKRVQEDEEKYGKTK